MSLRMLFLWGLWLCFGLGVPARAEILADPITYRKVVKNGVDSYELSNSARVPVSIKLQLTLNNVTVSGPSDLLLVPAGGTVAGPSFRRANSSLAWSYNWTYRYNFGDYRLARAPAPFALPWQAGTAHTVGQGFGGSRSHTGTEGYAIDVPMDEGTRVHAAQSGLVVYVQEHFREGGWRPELRGKENHVILAHPDGTLTRYLHLRFQGVSVELGDWVRSGSVLGYSGDVGYSSGPHLHFDVSRPGRDLVTETIPFEFLRAGVPVTPREGMILSR